MPLLSPTEDEKARGAARGRPMLEHQAEVMSGVSNEITVSYNRYLKGYLAVSTEGHAVGGVFSNDAVFRTAPRPEGPWSEPVRPFTQIAPASGFRYGAKEHPEFSSESGKVVLVSYPLSLGGAYSNEIHRRRAPPKTSAPLPRLRCLGVLPGMLRFQAFRSSKLGENFPRLCLFAGTLITLSACGAGESTASLPPGALVTGSGGAGGTSTDSSGGSTSTTSESGGSGTNAPPTDPSSGNPPPTGTGATVGAGGTGASGDGGRSGGDRATSASGGAQIIGSGGTRSDGSGGRFHQGSSGSSSAGGRSGNEGGEQGTGGGMSHADAGNASHCSNATRDADETDIDCGGESCAPCQDGKRCKANADCASNRCLLRQCRSDN